MREAADARALSPIEEAVVCVGESERGPELHAFAGGTACLYTARAPGRERANEDAVALIPFDEDSGVIAVADGVGGLPAGALAAGAAVQALQSTLAASRERGQTLRSAILDGIDNANHAVLESGIGAAATFAVVEIEGLRLRPFHIGDCEILLLGQRGKLKLQTISHAPVAQAVDAGMLDREAAMHHADRHLVSNVVGAADMRIEMGSWRTIAARDTLVVASDGLCDNLRLDEIVQRARKGTLAAIARELVAMAQARMRGHDIDAPSKPDDLSFVIFRPGMQRRAGAGRDAAA